MADISKLKIDGTTYDIKDTVARATMSGAILILGATTTALVDEATTNPITVNGESVTAEANNAVFYNSKEFVFDGTMWHEFGDMTGLGDMAEHDLSDVEITTTVSQPTATTTATTTEESVTLTRTADVAVSKTDETIKEWTVTYGGATGTDAETLIFTPADKTVAKTVSVSTQPTFTGTVDVPTSFTTTVSQPTATTTADDA